PSCPSVMPSHGAGTLNSNGNPPAAWIPSLTRWAIVFKCMWPGLISVKELAIPIMGLTEASSMSTPVPIKMYRLTILIGKSLSSKIAWLLGFFILISSKWFKKWNPPQNYLGDKTDFCIYLYLMENG